MLMLAGCYICSRSIHREDACPENWLAHVESGDLDDIRKLAKENSWPCNEVMVIGSVLVETRSTRLADGPARSATWLRHPDSWQ
jgi:hypothetical protein